MNNAPANVDPIILNFGFDLNTFERIGNVPIKQTIKKNIIMNKIFNKSVIVYYYIVNLNKDFFGLANYIWNYYKKI